MVGQYIATDLIQLKSFPKSKKQEVISKISQKYESIMNEIRERKHPSASIQCYYCHEKGKIIGHGSLGKDNKRPRYYCKGCNKTFNDHTGTIFHNLKLRKYMLPFLELMLEGNSIRETAKSLGVSPTTVHRWRHLVLKFIEKYMFTYIEELLEMKDRSNKLDDSFTESSYREINPCHKGLRQKQVPTRTTLVEFQYKRLGYYFIRTRQLSVLKPASVLVRTVHDLHSATTSIASQLTAVEHVEAKQSRFSSADFRLLHHCDHAQKLHTDFNEMYKRMRGVAQPYLNGYLQWHSFLAKIRIFKNMEQLKAVLFACI